MSLRLIAIGDIHGEISLLVSLLNGLHLTHEDRLIFLGDYVDRGENTPATIEFLRQFATQFHCIFLKGNHEDLMVDYLTKGKKYLQGIWEHNGGSKTLMQYQGNVPLEHLAFLASTIPAYTVGPYVFVHAGFDPSKPLTDQKPHDMLWMREPWLEAGTVKDFDGVVFHGHTPEPDPEKAQHNQRINLDAGAYQTGQLRFALIDPETGKCEVAQIAKAEPDSETDSETVSEQPDAA